MEMLANLQKLGIENVASADDIQRQVDPVYLKDKTAGYSILICAVEEDIEYVWNFTHVWTM